MSTLTSRMSGCLLVLLGAWGALVPFIGPYFGYAYTPDKAWQYTSGRLWLSILPGAAVFLGGLLILALSRSTNVPGGLLAALGGIWFVIGVPVLAVARPGNGPGSPATVSGAMFSPATMHLLENIGFFSGLGVVIVFFAAIAIGRSGVTRYAPGEVGADAENVDAFNPAM
jgi:hypothetical protein